MCKKKRKREKDSPYTRRDSSVDARHRDTERWTACWQLSPTKQLTADQFSKRTTTLTTGHPLQRSKNLRTLVSRCSLDRIIDRAIFNVQPGVHGSSPMNFFFLLSFDSCLKASFYSFFSFEEKAKRKRANAVKRSREERTRGTFDGKSRRNSNGASCLSDHARNV